MKIRLDICNGIFCFVHLNAVFRDLSFLKIEMQISKNRNNSWSLIGYLILAF